MSDIRTGMTGQARVRTAGPEEEAPAKPAPNGEKGRAQGDREAAARLSAWVEGEGGMTSKSAASMLAPVAPRSNGPTRNELLAAELARKDKPLEDDVIGNMLPTLLVTGVATAVKTALAEGLGAVASHVAKHAVIEVVGEQVVHAGAHGAVEVAKSFVPAPAIADDAKPLEATPTPAPTSAGRSGARGASEPATEPTQSIDPRQEAPTFRDRVPYAPGRAPLRVPEAPMSIRG